MLGRLITTRPETVVQDDEEYLVLYSHPNTLYRSTVLRDRYSIPLAERVRQMLDVKTWQLEDRRSGGNHMLLISPPNTWHSVWLLWSDNWDFVGWYVNFQSPYQRTERGVVVEDLTLDIKVAADLSWSWKDEDEFDEMIRQGAISSEQAAGVESAKADVLDLIERRQAPFDSSWKDWRPPHEWAVSELPTDPDNIL